MHQLKKPISEPTTCGPAMSRRSFVGQAVTALSILSVPAGTVWAQAGSGSASPLDDALFTAVKRDDGSRMRRLIEDSLNVNIIGPDGHTPMTLALQLGSENAFDALMASKRTNIEFRNANDESPLMIAAIRGNVSAVQRLMRQGAAVNKTGWTPLHYAASGDTEQQLQITRLLLQAKADVNARSPNGTTPLMMASSYGSEDVVQALLQAGADAALRNEQGLQATDFAKRVGRDSLASRLPKSAGKKNNGNW